MPRIASFLCGEVAPGTAPDLNWLPPQIAAGLGVGGTPAFSLSYLDGLGLFWLVATVNVDFNITSVINPGPFVNNVNVSPVSASATDETKLGCVSSAVMGYSDSNITIGFDLVSYDTGASTFGYSMLIAGTGSGPQLSSTSLGGSASGVTCTILGNAVPLFDASGESTSGFITITKNSWWAYDNGLTGGTNGPIYDTTSGATLITPIPIGL